MVSHCITLQQVEQEAVRRVMEDGTLRKIYVRPNGKLVIRVDTDPIFVSTQVEPLAYVGINGQIRGFN